MPNLITIPFTFLVAGEPIDPTSIVLSDSAPTYGVKRTDNNNVVVPAGTAMNRVAQGVYSYGFFEPAPGLTYQYSVKTVASAVTAYSVLTNTIAAYYPDLSRVQNMYGATNIAAWSNLDNDVSNTLDIPTVQDALTRTDNWFNRKLREYDLVTPLDRNSSDFAYIADLANEYAGVQIYLSRGRSLLDAGQDAVAGKMQWHYDHATGELNRILADGIDGISATPNEPTGGIGVVTQVDPATGLSNLPAWPYRDSPYGQRWVF